MLNARNVNRRTVLKTAGASAAAAMIASCVKADGTVEDYKPKGNLKQSVCAWCYRLSPADLAAHGVKMGLKSVELLSAEQFLTIKPTGLTCAILTPKGNSITDGLNRKQNHARIEKGLREGIEFAADQGIPNVICMSGNRKGMDDQEGMKNCAEALKKVVGFAEEKKVTICMEGLNSKVDHKDYMYDKTPWGVELCKMVGSPRFKLLYDIYHMQIMEGDVIATIRKYKDYIGHYHTGGVPGRHEIDDTQELNYPAICKAILKTGYTGYLSQEFIPAHEPMASLAASVRICDV
ncbi:MAG TPA: TIM barrel protein [Gemmataceae bacterium]|jgi:hydroxypyruvate isomerase|nr:TIM barrel protein [Gemmataceae bacterium]